MKTTVSFLLSGMALALMLACSSDEADAPQGESNVVLDIAAFANTGNDIVQIDLRTDAPEPIITSLTETFDLRFLENTRSQFDTESAAYYTWQNQESLVYYKDLSSGLIFTESDLCGFSSESDQPKFIRGIWGNAEFVAMAYAAVPDGEAPQTRIRIFSRSDETCRDLEVPDAGIAGIRQMLLRGDFLLVLYQAAETGLPVIRVLELSTGDTLTQLDLDGDFLAATLRDTDLLVFGENQTFSSLGLENLTFRPEVRIPDFPRIASGLFQTRFSGDQILVPFIYQQPSLFFSQPAVYDLQSGAFTAGGQAFLPALQNRIEADTGDRFLFGNFDADPDSGRVVISYVKGDGSTEGGLVVCDFQGKPFQILPLPVVPERVVIRSVEYP